MSCLIASICDMKSAGPRASGPTVFAAEGVCRPASGSWHGGLLPRPPSADVEQHRSEFGQFCNWSAP